MLRYLEIKQQLLNEISTMKANEKLPSRPRLCKALDTTRTTLDKAIRELSEEGYLVSQNGSGTYVAGGEVSGFRAAGSWGVIVPNIMESIYPGLVRGIENVAQNYGATITLCNSDNSVEKQKRYLQQLIQGGASGIIIVPVITDEPQKIYELYEQVKRITVPLVFCNRAIPTIDVPLVTSNNFYGGYMATMHLIRKGYKNIAFISRKNYCTSMERCQGYLAALVESGLEVNRNSIILECGPGGEGHHRGYEEMTSLLQGGKPLDAVFCFNDYVARGICAAIRDCGLQISEDIGVIGYDNEIFCDAMEPKLSSISFRNIEVGNKAAELLYNIINGNKELPAFKYYLFQPEIVERQSCLGPKRAAAGKETAV